MINIEDLHPVAYLSTDGGPHPAEKWGAVIADQIIKIEEHGVSSNMIRSAGFDLRNEIAVAAEKVVALVQSMERAALAEHGAARLDRGLDDVRSAVELLVADILFETSKTVFAGHFDADHVRVYLTNLAIRSLSTVLWIERSWFADQHPETDQAIAFRARWND